MHNKIKFLVLGIFIVGLTHVYAAENLFKKNNPDGKKYEFARSYICALTYFHNIELRWKTKPPKKRFAGDDFKIIKGSMDYLVMDNADLRVSKNYMIKYLDSSNLMMRKVSDLMIIACNQDIDLNNQSKKLWAEWYAKKSNGRATPAAERTFVKVQQDLDDKRRKSDESIIKASGLLTKILLSQENLNEKGRLLAITEKQRNKLIDDLDVYGKNVLDWGLKRGQTTLEASIAIIREVLEDSIYTSHK